MTTPPTRETARTLRTVLMRSWWLLFPCFTGLAFRLTAERACGDPYDLLPGITADPKWAWPLAAIYLLAHLWMLAACLLTIDEAGAFAPSLRVIRRVWGPGLSKVLLMTAVFVLEYSPVSLWRWFGAGIACR
jgi:hypothetical protein